MVRSIRNTNVAVVGGAGFLGSHLVNHLIGDRGCKVLVIDNLVAGRREYVHPSATFVHHDITGSEERLRQLFSGYDVQFVLNYSAMPYIPISFARPIHVCDVNFMGAMKIINAAQEAGVNAILQVSSAEIYGEGQIDPDETKHVIKQQLDERAPVVPHSSYGVAKAAVDNWVQCRWKEAKTPCIALRQFNCLGERDVIHPYVVPEIYRQLKKQVGQTKATVYLGNNSFRDFLYAGDAVRMAVEVLELGEFGSVYNLGSQTGIKMYDLAGLMGRLMGFAHVIVVQDQARIRPWEIWHLLACNDKVNALGVGAPTVDLEEALRRTITSLDQQQDKWDW